MSLDYTNTHRGWTHRSLSHVVGGFAKSRLSFLADIVATRYTTLWLSYVRLEARYLFLFSRHFLVAAFFLLRMGGGKMNRIGI